MDLKKLKLANQICFPMYATSRLITKAYKPLLDNLNLTYPQYLVLLVLWEEDEVPVKEISSKLLLESNTLTPLLKRMEKASLIVRTRSVKDERKVIIKLTEKGKELREEAEKIPEKLLDITTNSISKKEAILLKSILDKMLVGFNNDSAMEF